MNWRPSRRNRGRTGSFVPRVEALEDRCVPAQHGGHLFIPKLSQIQFTTLDGRFLKLAQSERLVVAVPDLANITLFMKSVDDGTLHQLLIQDQFFAPDGHASFAGFTDGELVGFAQLGWDAQGIHIVFANLTLDRVFDGHITAVSRHWHIDGQVMVRGVGGHTVRGDGPGHLVGDSSGFLLALDPGIFGR
jgi:hypothetical protein